MIVPRYYLPASSATNGLSRRLRRAQIAEWCRGIAGLDVDRYPAQDRVDVERLDESASPAMMNGVGSRTETVSG